MSGGGWTRGPWFAHEPFNPNRRDWGVVAGRKYDPSVGARRRIAWVGNSSALGQSEAVQSEVAANARLIAASPALFDALEALTRLYVALPDPGNFGFWNPEQEPEAINAHAALAAALGEPSTPAAR